jgi:GR25 family glycosyltransferase involved in LPS biosynthesis
MKNNYLINVENVIIFSLLLFFSFLFMNTIFKNEKMIDNFEQPAKLFPYVDIIYWINLDHRKDRSEQFLEQLKKIKFPKNRIVRISGVYEKNRGHLGCSKSHIKCLEEFLKTSHKNCIIFEDDFDFIVPSAEIEDGFKKLSTIDYDVCMLAGIVQSGFETEYPFLRKVNNATTSSGYVITKEFAPVLLENIQESSVLLEDTYNENRVLNNFYSEALDQYWFRIQPQNNWYIFNPVMGTQRNSASDIEVFF